MKIYNLKEFNTLFSSFSNPSSWQVKPKGGEWRDMREKLERNFTFEYRLKEGEEKTLEGKEEILEEKTFSIENREELRKEYLSIIGKQCSEEEVRNIIVPYQVMKLREERGIAFNLYDKEETLSKKTIEEKLKEIQEKGKEIEDMDKVFAETYSGYGKDYIFFSFGTDECELFKLTKTNVKKKLKELRKLEEVSLNEEEKRFLEEFKEAK